MSDWEDTEGWVGDEPAEFEVDPGRPETRGERAKRTGAGLGPVSDDDGLDADTYLDPDGVVRLLHTEQALCGGRLRAGGRCRRPAGWGTSHAGFGQCKFHAGGTPNGRTRAARLESLSLARSLELPVDIDPHGAMEDAVRTCAAIVQYLRGRVATLGESELLELDMKTMRQHPSPWVRMLGEWVDRLSRVAKSAADAGVAERHVRVAEDQAAAFVAMLELAVDLLDLDAAQRERVPGVMLRVLDELERGNGGALPPGQ